VARNPALNHSTSPEETQERRTISGTQRINLRRDVPESDDRESDHAGAPVRASRAPTLPAPALLPSIDLLESAEKNAAAVVARTKEVSTGVGDALLLFVALVVAAGAVTWFATLFFP
jgi:hypothetical protein